MSDKVIHKLWFSFFDRCEYRGEEPPYFDLDKIEWVKIIKANKEAILNEFQTVNAGSYSPYFNQSVVNERRVWKTISLRFWTVNYYRNQKKYPVTMSVLNQLPGLLTASINKLEAGGHIVPHNGDSNGFYRCHFGLDIPAGLPEVGFKVLAEDREWKKGALLVFCDANMHEAWNKSNKDRYILVFDVIRPEFRSQKRKLVHVITASLFLQGLAEKIPFLYKLPLILQGGIHFFARLCSIIFIPIRNVIAKLFT
jgi:ornithine lipid ester-linked acyl 2-hydroxylase